MCLSEVVPITAPPIRDESLIGYLIRVSHINFYERSSWILKLAGLDYARIKASKWNNALPKLSSILGQDTGKLSLLAPLNALEGNHSKVGIPNGEVISRYFLEWPTKAICSQCARENGYLSSFWDLRLVTHCPKHLCRLREGCSDCGENSRFYRTTVDFCRCSKPNENADSALSDAHIGLLRLLSNKYVGTDFDLEQYGFSNQLKSASFREIIETVAILGSSLLSYANLDGRCYHQLSAEKIVNHMAVSADALANWPNGFISHIGKLFFPAEDYSALSCVGYSLEKLYQFSLDHQDRVPVVFAGFEAYLHSVASEALVVPPKTITPRSGRHKWLVCAADAREWLRVSREHFDRLIKEGHLKTVTFRRGGTVNRLLTHESIDAYLDLKSRLISIGAAANMLSISLHTLKTLVDAGFLRPFHSPDLDGNHCWRFDEEVVAGFLHELEETAKKCSILPVQLVAAVQKYNKQGLSYVRMLKMIKKGEIELLMYSQKERGFLKFGVDPEVLQKLFSDERQFLQPKPIPEWHRRTGLFNG